MSLFAGGARAAVIRPGLSLGFDYAQDYFHDVAGGVSRGGGAPGRVHLSAAADGRLWGGQRTDRFYVGVLGTLGSSISAHAGDLQGLDNIEAHNTAKIFSAWYEHTFRAQHVRMRVGVQDYNAWFDVLDAAGVFINSSFGLDPTISQLPVSTFPITTLGAAVRLHSAGGAYAMAGVYDGKPGLSGHPNGTHIDLRAGDGVLAAMEVGVSHGGTNPYKAAVGGWYRTTGYTGPDGQHRRGDEGMYAIAQHRIGAVFGGAPVDGFLQAGFANSRDNQINRYLGMGVTVTGPVPGRASDVLGVGVARAHLGGTYRSQVPGSAAAETVVEATYQAPISAHFSIQPDVQYIIDPGASRQVGNAWVLGARADLSW